MQFGYFDDDQREYVITQPDTPLPWLNYLGNQDYFGIISNTAGGYSFYKDARLRRITRYRYNNVPLDEGGRYLYLRDNATGAFWSPTWQPTRTNLENYTCRQGMGYTIIASRHEGIQAEVTYFVPPDETLEIWRLVLTNDRKQAAQLSIFSFIEFCLWDAQDDATNYQRNFNTGEVEVVDEVIYHKTEYRERRNHFAYFACSEVLAGFDTQREDFLGAYRGLHQPIVVEEGKSRNSIAHGWAPVGSQHVKVELAPGETRQVIFVLGYHENPVDQKFEDPARQVIYKRTVKPVIERYCNPEQVSQAFEALKAYWAHVLGGLQVQTPDAHTNRMVNLWNAYQCMITFNLSRSASFYESGIGRGIGFRDSNQDMLGFVHMVPERARLRILEIATTQLPDGGAYHQYQPLTKKGNNDIGTNFNDDPLWLVVGVCAYVCETGDAAILDEQVPYDNQPGSEMPLYEHLLRSLNYTLQRTGLHGLPLIGRADWNDCLNLNCFSDTSGQSFQITTNKEGVVAESVFIAGLFVLAANHFADLANFLRRVDHARIFRGEAARMSQVVLAHGWDGDWFRRAYDDASQPVGSKQNAEGKIFIEPQGMCVMAGIGKNGQALRALDSVRQLLATPHGIMLLQPAFTRYYLNLGEISSYPPGYKENASVFCHTNPWVMIAEAICGRGDQAFDYYQRINPSAREAISEVHRCEPYVYAQMIAGRDAPTHGEAKNSWLTGTAAWNYVAITQWILGIRPEFNGLRIAPVIPSDWKTFSVTRLFRGVRYEIDVERVGEGNRVELSVDGLRIAGQVVPLPAAGQTCVRVKCLIN